MKILRGFVVSVYKNLTFPKYWLLTQKQLTVRLLESLVL